jgi:hypothetical protein
MLRRLTTSILEDLPRILSVTLLCLALVTTTTACVAAKEATEDARKTEAAIRSELGVDATVGFNVFSGTNGKKVRVTIRLKPPPPADSAAMKSKIADVVGRNFRSHVDQVDVVF